MPARRVFSSASHRPWEKMRSRLLTPEIPEDLAVQILEEIAGSLEDEQPYVPPFDEDITLHDLFDLDPGSESQPEDLLAEAVDQYFPEAMILAAENPPPEVPVVDLTTSPTPAGEMPTLSPQDMDLQCYEPMLPIEEDNEEGSGVVFPQDYTRIMVKQAIDLLNETEGDEEEEFQLDAPENPGHDCKSCRYHRGKTGDPGAMCSLCYLRLNAAFVYSKFNALFSY